MHKKHLFGGQIGKWKDCLGRELAAELNKQCRRWLVENGYEAQ